MRRTVIPWVAAFVIFALATVGGVALANATVFSAGSFVRIYLDAIARGDAESALAAAGRRRHRARASRCSTRMR